MLYGCSMFFFFFFFNDTATTEIYTLSLHDALPIFYITANGGPEVLQVRESPDPEPRAGQVRIKVKAIGTFADLRSEEHTSELQSPCNLVCRLLLEKKKMRALKRGCGRLTPAALAVN